MPNVTLENNEKRNLIWQNALCCYRKDEMKNLIWQNTLCCAHKVFYHKNVT